jgi:PiT family inorganic phosphate transporter
LELIASLFFLSSGLFLGWSLGANDASNVFGSAVGSRMVRFSTAAFLCSVFVIIGAVSAGAGASGGLEALGAVNALAGSFTTALAAAVTVYWMTRLGLPVSTSQAVVGAIVGWNWFSGSITDPGQLAKIVGTWIFCPILAGLFAALLYFLAVRWIGRVKPHLLRLDANVRSGLILAGIFGSYSLGANNIGNVMGVFVDSSPFRTIRFGSGWEISGIQQLFLLGAIAIAVGVYTFSRRVMMTVGGSLMTLSPMGALVVVVSNSLVLFIFSSSALSNQLVRVGLPPIPLVPVSSSQAVIGAVIGIGCLQGIKGLRQVRWGVLARIASGWVTTPLIAAVVGLCMLFVVQNVFGAQVYKEVYFQITPPVLERLESQGLATSELRVQDRPIGQAVRFRKELRSQVRWSPSEEQFAMASAEIYPTTVDLSRLKQLEPAFLSPDQSAAIAGLQGRSFRHRWQLEEALANQSAAWRMGAAGPASDLQNDQLRDQLLTLTKLFHARSEASDLP